MANSFYQKCLNKAYELFHKDTAKMLIITGTLGWILSAGAQLLAIAVNPKIKKEQKGFLFPQELGDAVVNITSFFVITLLAKKVFSKLASTGKIAPKEVREYIIKNKDLSEKYGKVGFNLDKISESDPLFPKEIYESNKNLSAALGTVGASIVASNIITPVIRNNFASKIQNTYINNTKQNISPNMKV